MKLAALTLFAMLLVSPSCSERFHFRSGTVEVNDAHGARTYYSNFQDGELGKIGQGYIFRAKLPDGGTLMIEGQPQQK